MSGAIFSPDRVFRYRLWRTWGAPALRALVFIGVNPSTADEDLDDPTIRRCIGFAKREGCGSLVMLNVFAFRATDPRQLQDRALRGLDIVGPLNDAELLLSCTLPNALVVAGWGLHGLLQFRDRDVCNLLDDAGVKLHCLGKTKTGIPRHPLYLRRDAPLTTYNRIRQ